MGNILISFPSIQLSLLTLSSHLTHELERSFTLTQTVVTLRESPNFSSLSRSKLMSFPFLTPFLPHPRHVCPPSSLSLSLMHHHNESVVDVVVLVASPIAVLLLVSRVLPHNQTSVATHERDMLVGQLCSSHTESSIVTCIDDDHDYAQTMNPLLRMSMSHLACK